MKQCDIYIDETGGYNLHAVKSFVGGFAGDSQNITKLEQRSQQMVKDYFRQNIPEHFSGDPNFYIALLHFIDLHLYTRNVRNEQSHHKIYTILTPTHAQEILNIVAKLLNETPLTIFKVSGHPAMYSSPQTHYLFQLQGALIGLIKEKIKESYTHFHIVIATRNLLKILPNLTEAEQEDIYIHYQKTLHQFLSQQFPKTTITISFERAHKTWLLSLADMALGYVKYLKQSIQSEKILNLNAASYINDITPKLELIQIFKKGIKESHDAIDHKCLALFDFIRSETLEEKEKGIVIDLLKSLPKARRIELDKIFLKTFTEYYMENKYFKNNSLTTMALRIIELLDQPQYIFLKSVHRAYRILFELNVHIGGFDSKNWENFIAFNQKYQEELYNNPLENYLQNLEARLIHFQILFNEMNFKNVFDTVKKDEKQWSDIIRILNLQKNYSDNNQTKLKGTVGQAYIFIGDLENNEEDIKLGYEEIRDSLQYVSKTSKDYAQGVNYLVTCGWTQQNLEQALKDFSLLPNHPTIETLQNYRKTGSSTFQGILNNTQQTYEFLNQLRLTALDLQKNHTKTPDNSIENLSTLAQQLCTRENSHAYPNFMLIKWILSILDHQHYDLIQTKANHWLQTAQWESPLLEYMALPLYYMLDHAEFIQRVQTYRAAPYSQGAKLLWEKRATLLEKMLKKEANPFEANRLLPYYYA